MSGTRPSIGFVLGSKSDLPQLEKAEKFLEGIGVSYEVRIISAHRTPQRAHDYASSAKERGLETIVAVAGMAAHLAASMPCWPRSRCPAASRSRRSASASRAR